jgi:hypothetical protein
LLKHVKSRRPYSLAIQFDNSSLALYPDFGPSRTLHCYFPQDQLSIEPRIPRIAVLCLFFVFSSNSNCQDIYHPGFEFQQEHKSTTSLRSTCFEVLPYFPFCLSPVLSFSFTAPRRKREAPASQSLALSPGGLLQPPKPVAHAS